MGRRQQEEEEPHWAASRSCPWTAPSSGKGQNWESFYTLGGHIHGKIRYLQRIVSKFGTTGFDPSCSLSPLEYFVVFLSVTQSSL